MWVWVCGVGVGVGMCRCVCVCSCVCVRTCVCVHVACNGREHRENPLLERTTGTDVRHSHARLRRNDRKENVQREKI